MAGRLVRYSRWAAVVGPVLALTMTLLYAETAPSGEVLIPRIGEILVPENQTLKFSGWVDFPLGAGVITIFVHTKFPIGSYIWLPVATVAPSSTGTLVGGQTRYNWAYSASRSQLFVGESWPEGGTA